MHNLSLSKVLLGLNAAGISAVTLFSVFDWLIPHLQFGTSTPSSTFSDLSWNPLLVLGLVWALFLTIKLYKGQSRHTVASALGLALLSIGLYLGAAVLIFVNDFFL